MQFEQVDRVALDSGLRQRLARRKRDRFEREQIVAVVQRERIAGRAAAGDADRLRHEIGGAFGAGQDDCGRAVGIRARCRTG